MSVIKEMIAMAELTAYFLWLLLKWSLIPVIAISLALYALL